MSSRASALKKIEGLYGLIENMHSLALQQAAASMHEAEAAIGVQCELMRDAQVDAQQALAGGDRERWAVAELQRVLGGQRRLSLEEVRKVRETVAQEAQEVYRASRIQRGQIKTVVDAGERTERIVEERRAQHAADDRFLSRMRWSQLRDQTA